MVDECDVTCEQEHLDSKLQYARANSSKQHMLEVPKKHRSIFHRFSTFHENMSKYFVKKKFHKKKILSLRSRAARAPVFRCARARARRLCKAMWLLHGEVWTATTFTSFGVHGIISTQTQCEAN